MSGSIYTCLYQSRISYPSITRYAYTTSTLNTLRLHTPNPLTIIHSLFPTQNTTKSNNSKPNPIKQTNSILDYPHAMLHKYKSAQTSASRPGPLTMHMWRERTRTPVARMQMESDCLNLDCMQELSVCMYICVSFQEICKRL